MQEIYTLDDVRRILENNQYQHTVIFKTLLKYAKIRYADLKNNSAAELKERANFYKKILLDDVLKLKEFVLSINKKIINKRLLSLSQLDADDRITIVQTLRRLSKRDRLKIYECICGDTMQIDDDILCRFIVLGGA